MGPNSVHYITLGVFRGDSEQIIRAAFRKRAKECHSDLNVDVDPDEIYRVNEAYAFFTSQNFFSDDADAPIRSSRQIADLRGVEDDAEGADYKQIVLDYMFKYRLKFNFEGHVVSANAEPTARSYDDIPHVLAQRTYDADVLCDEIMLDRRKRGEAASVMMLRAAMRAVARDASIKRQDEIMMPLMKTLNPVEQHLAELQLKRFCAACFDMDVELSIAILKKFIHQLKSKLLGREVKRHIAAIFQSKVQGGGKTTCAKAFLQPLSELSSGETSIGNFVDGRNVDLYRYLAVFLDDLDEIDTKQIGTFKALATGDEIVRRRLGTSKSIRIKQRSSLMGTCNRPIGDLIPDPSGNRRLATLPFRNGDVSHGGCPSVWKTISETDFSLLWRSVDVFGEDPIKARWGEVRVWQNRFRTPDPVEAWLLEVDVSSNAIRGISTKRGARAEALYALFIEETGSSMTMTMFGKRLSDLAAKGHGPFGARIMCDYGRVYPLRSQAA